MSLIIEVIETDTEEVVREIDVTGKGKRHVAKVEAGVNRNLNHERFHTQVIHNPTT